MTPLAIKTGDATLPQADGPKIIAHICNDIGGWGKGFVVALSRRWPEPERAFRAWYAGRDANDFWLGEVQLVPVGPDTWVANMIAQHAIATTADGPPIRYDAVEQCLEKLAAQATELGASIHMPRIGCGLGGGSWDRIEPLIVKTMCARGIAVTLYELGAARA